MQLPVPDLNPRFDSQLLSRVEDAGLNASAPPQQRWVDGWLVRFSAGKAKRARCINAVADGRLSVASRLAQCEQVYADAGLPMVVRITPFTRPAHLDDTLAEMGLRSIDDTRVMVLDRLDALPALDWPAGWSAHNIGLDPFAQRVGALRGSPLSQRQAHAERLLHSPVPFTAFELREQGEVLACGQYAMEGDLVGLYDVYTAEDARGRGCASRLCLHMLAHARSRGARHAYLQVEHDNHSARAIYHRLGFADGYAYHYRTR
ncbi:GNAT family N-acetyltransferase [Piscinibacter gummiphilus]|uniref:GNAT family N-acetyltransferase n=1 Tax=Piscinibacter gummiphilus TaxID=946333 RepID=A0ABZ0CTL6_9BURK|nr:GNAT family N-acetyltransferase [Piscinibacter gummiphilus]WOB08320.1 GNAT family N-acetyltransferase [Piscinibacter gummiphilus]